jgi:putative sigma-54 modulation protein
MQLDLSGHHVEITPAMREYVHKKFERVVRHFDHMIDVHCILTVEKLTQKAEATVQVPGGKLHADAVNPNMYASIDLLADKLDRLVKKHKEKIQDHHAAEVRKGAAGLGI